MTPERPVSKPAAARHGGNPCLYNDAMSPTGTGHD